MAGKHNHIDHEAGDTKVFWAVFINLLLTVAQIIGGVLSGSLALIADAIHNLSDAISLALAFVARKIARRAPDAAMTFGYGRAEIVAALINYTTLIVIGVYLIYEAILRFFDPIGVDGWMVVIVASIALLIDLATALLTFSMSKTSMNIRAAFLHNVADALGSIAVILAGTLIIWYDWRLIDPIVTLLIAGYILWMAFSEIGSAIRILMLGSPEDMDIEQVLAAAGDVPGVVGLHHAHLWQMQEHEVALDAHVQIEAGQWDRADAIKAQVRAVLQDHFGISHVTLELESAEHACVKAEIIGHGETAPEGDDHDH